MVAGKAPYTSVIVAENAAVNGNTGRRIVYSSCKFMPRLKYRKRLKYTDNKTGISQKRFGVSLRNLNTELFNRFV